MPAFLPPGVRLKPLPALGAAEVTAELDGVTGEEETAEDIASELDAVLADAIYFLPTTGLLLGGTSTAIEAALEAVDNAAEVLMVWWECLMIGFPAPVRASAESVGLGEDPVGSLP